MSPPSERWAVSTGTREVVDAVAFAPDGKTLATGSHDGTVKLWNVAVKEEVATLMGHTAPVYSVAFSPDRNTLASAGGDGTVRLWRAASFAATDGPVIAQRTAR